MMKTKILQAAGVKDKVHKNENKAREHNGISVKYSKAVNPEFFNPAKISLKTKDKIIKPRKLLISRPISPKQP